MWGLLNAATAPIRSAATQFARNQAAAAARKAGLNTLRAYRRSPVGSPEELAAAGTLTANLPALQGLGAASAGLTTIGVSNLTGFTGQLEGALNQVGPAVDRFFGRITPQAIQQFGREQGNKGWGGALEVAIPGTGFLAAPFIPNTQPSSKPSGTRPVGTQAVLNGKPVYWGGDNYGWQQLNQTGSSATLSSLNTPGSQGRFIQEQGFRPIGGTPAERAQAAETSRVAQLTAQDPELQRYEAARLKAVAPGATPEQVQSAEDIGMQIWQQKYGNTPIGQPGGAVGRFNPLMDRTFGYQSGMSPQEMQAMQATAAPVQVAPGAVPYQKGDLGTRATLETGYDPAAYGLTPEKIEEMKQKLLQQAK
jgi:hypothetical protein